MFLLYFRNTLCIEQEVDAFIAEFPPVAAVLCAKPPPPPPPPLPEPPTIVPSIESNDQHPNQLDFQSFSSSFGTQIMPNTFVPPPNPFSNMLSLPPPPNQPPFYANPNESVPVFQANIAPPKPLPPPPSFFGPPPIIMEAPEVLNRQQPEQVSIKANQFPPDFKINQPPPDFKTDQLPTDFSVEKPPPQLNFPELRASNSGSSSPIGGIRFDSDNHDVNESSARPNEPVRLNPFSMDRKFPTNNPPPVVESTRPNPTPITTPTYTNPFSKPPSQICPPIQQVPNRFQSSHNYAQPTSMPPSNIVTSVPPPNAAMFAFRTPSMFSGPPPPQQTLSIASTNLLHSIPPPKPLQLNKIPAPQDLDLNAIPEPKLNLDAIKVPDGSDISRGNLTFYCMNIVESIKICLFYGGFKNLIYCGQ